MRIIAGTAKGRTLKSLKGLATRPTLDRVREAVFNTLGTKVREAKVLDLFAGSGAIGLEALSRGARSCYFNDQNKAACQIIKENLQKCGLEDLGQVFNMDGQSFISYLRKKRPVEFDLIYIDPPYLSDYYPLYLKQLEESGLVADGAIIMVEGNRSLCLMEEYHFLKLNKKSKYGDTVIWYYKFLREE